MASQSKSDAARANGSKSRGPITPEGKARSSKNALKHGLTSQFEALSGESQEDFDALLESHMTQYQSKWISSRPWPSPAGASAASPLSNSTSSTTRQFSARETSMTSF